MYAMQFLYCLGIILLCSCSRLRLELLQGFAIRGGKERNGNEGQEEMVRDDIERERERERKETRCQMHSKSTLENTNKKHDLQPQNK